MAFVKLTYADDGEKFWVNTLTVRKVDSVNSGGSQLVYDDEEVDNVKEDSDRVAALFNEAR